MKQMLLFPDARPLVEKLGASFFRSLPGTPGVYLMRDAADMIVYVGKAKNLRRRLGSYRVANPERLARRHLRLLRAVTRVEILECPDEASALSREAELLRTLRPRFNRAGTWPAKSRLLAWRGRESNMELAIQEQPEEGWETLGMPGSAALALRGWLARAIWCALHPDRGSQELPCGWAHGHFTPIVQFKLAHGCEELISLVREMFNSPGNRPANPESGAAAPPAFFNWVRARLSSDLPPFSKAALEADLENLLEFVAAMRRRANRGTSCPPD